MDNTSSFTWHCCFQFHFSYHKNLIRCNFKHIVLSFKKRIQIFESFVYPTVLFLYQNLKEIGGAKVSKELGIPEGTIHIWLKAIRTRQLDIGDGSHTPESAMRLAEELKSVFILQ